MLANLSLNCIEKPSKDQKLQRYMQAIKSDLHPRKTQIIFTVRFLSINYVLIQTFWYFRPPISPNQAHKVYLRWKDNCAQFQENTSMNEIVMHNILKSILKVVWVILWEIWLFCGCGCWNVPISHLLKHFFVENISISHLF